MEAVPRLPMISFELKTSPENVQFGPQLKQYIATFYNEDPESYNTEINNLESLRAAAIRPTIDVSGCQLLKKYYCQLHFLKSRFPMYEGQAAAVNFSWKDSYSSMPCSVPDIRFELMCILYNIGALHTHLGALDSRTSPDGLKMACTHFQCAAWAFQTVKESYHQMIPYMSSVQAVHFMQQVCLAQAQECILEKSMMDNRKATITAKVAVQVVDHYKRALSLLSFGDDSFSSLVGSKTAKEWSKYLSFKISYHKCIALLFQGQQAEEQQKMGERVAFYQAACEQLDEARKLSSGLKQQKDLNEAIGFTSDVVEGKRKAAKNENEFIYHEEVPDIQALQEVKGASLVKGIAFNVNDVEVSGQDIFARLVPMEAHEASSLYSEKKAQKLRQFGELVESKDQALAEFMSSLQLEVFSQMRQATGLSQDLVDRAAALSAKPSAAQDLIAAMGRLSNSYHEVEAMLNEIQELLKEEDQNEKSYQELMGKRPPSIIATDLSREAAKYREAHNKANDSNQNLHKAMTTHVANLKILAQPLGELQKQIPSVELPNPNIDENCVKDIENLISKVEEMRNQRAMLWSQFREAVHKDDITSVLVTRQDQPLDQVFEQELEKHKELTSLIEQNVAAQENILKAFVDTYARSTSTRRYLQDIINKRNATVTALISSYDTYEDLVAKANKGIEFYNKLETNVSKLLQRIKSACKVQQEEREQMLLKNSVPVATSKDVPTPTINSAPKLKDYLDTRKKTRGVSDVNSQYYPQSMPDAQSWPPAVRPAPLGSEINEPVITKPSETSLTDRMAGLRMGNVHSNSAITNKQAYTITTDTYQPISSVTPNQDSTTTNFYGYQGYQMGYNTSSVGNYGQVTDSYTANYSYPISQPDGSATYNSAQISQSDGYASYNQLSQTNYSYNQIPNQASQQYNATTSLPNQASQSGAYGAYNQTASQTTQPAAYGAYSQTTSQASQPAAYGTYSQTASPASQPAAYGTYDQTAQPATYDAYNQSASQASQPAAYGAYNQSASQASQPAAYSTYQVSGQGSQTSLTNQPTQPVAYAGYDQAGQSYAQSSSIPNQGSQPDQGGQSYQTTNQVSQPNVYYPSGYSPAPVQQPVEQTYSYPNTFGSSEYATSVRPNISNVNYNSTYSSPVSDLKSSDSNTQNYVISNGQGATSYDQQYQYYYNNYSQNPTYPNNYASGYNYVTPTPQTSTSSVSVTTKESNVDLLTGLDFTVNQAPLIPQQKPSEPEMKPVQKSGTPKIVKDDKKEEPPKIEKIVNRKPLNNSEVKKLFTQEIDKFEKFVETLTNKTLSGPTNLDLKWKEVQDKQEAEKKVISVARCYPMKNRYPDILPYDYSRVELKQAKDDYINASHVKDVSYYAAPLIVSQAPLSSTISDFWTMIKEQNVELIVCLLNDTELGSDIYWPCEKGRDLSIPGMLISLISVTPKPHWIERLISINVPEKRDSRVIMHLQFTSPPGSLYLSSFVSFATEVISLFMQQRSTQHPVVVHCSSGIGRSGVMCLLVAAILEATSNPTAIPDLVSLTVKLSAWRKNILRDREHLKFAYEAFLGYMKEVLIQGQAKKVLNEVGIVKEAAPVEVKQENDDPLSSLDPFWASKKE